MAYDNIKSRKKPGLSISLGYIVLEKPQGGISLTTLSRLRINCVTLNKKLRILPKLRNFLRFAHIIL